MEDFEARHSRAVEVPRAKVDQMGDEDVVASRRAVTPYDQRFAARYSAQRGGNDRKAALAVLSGAVDIGRAKCDCSPRRLSAPSRDQVLRRELCHPVIGAGPDDEIGRASCRESVSVRVTLGGCVIIKKKKK